MHYFSSIGSGVRELRWPQIPYFLYLAIMTLTTVSTTVLYCDITNGFKPSPSFFFLIRCRLCISRLLSPFLILNIHVRSSVLFTSWFHTKLSHFLQCVQNPHSTRCFYARYTIILTISGSTTSRNLQSSAYLLSSMSLLRSHVLQWATKGPTGCFCMGMIHHVTTAVNQRLHSTFTHSQSFLHVHDTLWNSR